jgi:hypothetical protein
VDLLTLRTSVLIWCLMNVEMFRVPDHSWTFSCTVTYQLNDRGNL